MGRSGAVDGIAGLVPPDQRHAEPLSSLIRMNPDSDSGRVSGDDGAS